MENGRNAAMEILDQAINLAHTNNVQVPNDDHERSFNADTDKFRCSLY